MVGLVSALTIALSGCTDAPGAEVGNVVRIIDGDTLVINFESEDQTVRLLNVDTPETKHPDKPVECLGLEATAFLQDLLPPGTQVGLDFDVERHDQYDRTLAAVFTEDGALVNAEIARRGLGVPVLFEPNDKYYGAVQDAQTEAQSQHVGFFDADAECTVPAEVERTIQTLTEAMEASTGPGAAAAGAAVTSLAAALAAAKTLDAALREEKTALRWIAVAGGSATAFAGALSTKIGSGESRLTVLEATADRLVEAEAQAAAEKEATSKRKAAEAKAEAEQKAAAAAEREESGTFRQRRRRMFPRILHLTFRRRPHLMSLRHPPIPTRVTPAHAATRPAGRAGSRAPNS